MDRKSRVIVYVAASLLFLCWQTFVWAKPTKESRAAYEAGKKYYQKGDYAHAAVKFDKALELDAENKAADYYLDLISLERKNGESGQLAEKKQEILDEISKLDPSAKPKAKAKTTLAENVEEELKEVGKPEVVAERPEVLVAPERPGFKAYYEQGAGFKILPWLGWANYDEFYHELNPIDDYIMESEYLAYDNDEQYRRMLTALYTKAWGNKWIIDVGKRWPRFTYTWDIRAVYNEYQYKYGFDDQKWETHQADFLYTFPKLPYIGTITLNPVYKRIILRSHDDPNSNETRDEWVLNASMNVNQYLEIFGQYDYYRGKKKNTSWISRPYQPAYRAELRFRIPEFKLRITPAYNYSKVYYRSTPDRYTKSEYSLLVGKDWTSRWSSSHTLKWVYSETENPDAAAGGGVGTAVHEKGEYFDLENRISYEIFKDIYLTGGVDFNKAIAGPTAFNNVDFVIESELFKPGLIRLKVGYERGQYYNVDDGIDCFYVKLNLFM